MLPPARRRARTRARCFWMRPAREIAVHLLLVEPRADVSLVKTMLDVARGDLRQQASRATEVAVRQRSGGYSGGLALPRRRWRSRSLRAPSAARPSAILPHGPVSPGAVARAAGGRRAVGRLSVCLEALPPPPPRRTRRSRADERLPCSTRAWHRSVPAAPGHAKRLAPFDTPGPARGSGAHVARDANRSDLARPASASGPSGDARTHLWSFSRSRPFASCDELEEACVGCRVTSSSCAGTSDMVAFACISALKLTWAGSLADAEADALEATEAFTRARQWHWTSDSADPGAGGARCR